MKYESQKVYFTTYTDGSEGLTYTLSLDNDYDILVFDQQNNLISDLPIEIKATVLANGDALNKKDYDAFSLNITSKGATWQEGKHYSFSKKNGSLRIEEVPSGFIEASFKFSWAQKEGGSPILSKTFSLKKNISNTDLSLLVGKTVVNSSQKGGSIGVWIVCKDINGIFELDPGWVDRVYIEAKVDGKDYYAQKDDGRGFIEYEQGHTDPITVTLRDNSDNFLWDMETIEFVQDGEKGRGISSVNNYYLASDWSSGVTTEDGDWGTWSSSMPENFSKECRYLWNYEVVKDEDNETISKTDPTIIGTWGEDGKGISSIEEYYTTTKSNTDSPEGWIKVPDGDMPIIDATYRYLWNYEKINYTDASSTITEPAVIGVYGEKGDSGNTAGTMYIYTGTTVPTPLPEPPQEKGNIGSWEDSPRNASENLPYVWVSQGTYKEINGNRTYNLDWSTPELYSAWLADNVSGEKAATFYKLFGFDSDNTSEAIKYDKDGKAYIDAKFINTGALIVKKYGDHPDRDDDDVTLFSADIANENVIIGGWTVRPYLEGDTYSGSYLASADNAAFGRPTIMLSTKEIPSPLFISEERTPLMLKVGTNFGVDGNGTLYANNAVIYGDIHAGTGYIGNWKIASGILSSDDSGVILSPNGTNTNNIVFKAGENFKVTKDGILHANGAQIVGDILATHLELAPGASIEGVEIALPDNVLGTDTPVGDGVVETKLAQTKLQGIGNNTVYVDCEGGELENVTITNTWLVILATGDIIDMLANATVQDIDSTNNSFIVKMPGHSYGAEYVDHMIRYEYTYKKGGSRFVVSSDGLLEAQNALIYGKICTSEGLIGGWSIGKNGVVTPGAGMSSRGPVRFYGGSEPLTRERVITYDNLPLNTWATSGSFTLPNCGRVTSVRALCSNGGVVEISTPLPAYTDTIKYSYYKLGGNATTCQLSFECEYIQKDSIKFAVFEDGSMMASNANIVGGTLKLSIRDYVQFELGEDGFLVSKQINGLNWSSLMQVDAQGLRFTNQTRENLDYNFAHSLTYDPDLNKVALIGSWVSNACLATGSDRTLKHDIEKLGEGYSNLFDSLQPVRYKYNDGQSNRYHTGFIAQEVEDAVLSAGLTTKDFAAVCYHMDDNGNKSNYSVRYSEIVSLNTWQIQKLKPRVSSLEQTILDYESRISALENEIQNLKKS